MTPTLCLTSKLKCKLPQKDHGDRFMPPSEMGLQSRPNHNPSSRFTSQTNQHLYVSIINSSFITFHQAIDLYFLHHPKHENFCNQTQMRSSNEMTEQNQLANIWSMAVRRSPMRRSRRRGAAWRRCHARRPCRTPPASPPGSASPPSPC